jgi:hypothetical protein
VTDHSYSGDEIEAMERDMRLALDGYPVPQPFALVAAFTEIGCSLPHAFDFLIRYVAISECSKICAEKSRYYLERSLMEDKMCGFKPSMLASACLYLALFNSDNEGSKTCWNRRLHGFTGYSAERIFKLANQVASFVSLDFNASGNIRDRSSSSLAACIRKFSQPNLESVALFATKSVRLSGMEEADADIALTSSDK